ncbi:MAG: FMN-dependent NADH-azoreductase [Ruoffia tabacinasalis]|uniref:FMN-dependent NADH-azoreductase n=1 Tax=Ruoffia sp. FAM 20857 TaxID=3259515 RepID=UPI000EBA76E0|nr:FMN-dependent NADH-azoreductase [Aerococcaceae bacterium]
MNKTLLINSHPNWTNENTYSSKLQKKFLALYKERFGDENLTVINIYDTDIPKIEKNSLIDVWNKQQNNEILTESEKEVSLQSSSLLDEFKDHKRIVIVLPLHNFNIPSKLKDYLDNILIARETFKYTESGSVGLMSDDRNLLIIQSSGSIYTNNDRYSPLEFSYYYLKEMFENIMGFNETYIARAQGTTIQPIDEQQILSDAVNDLEDVFPKFYK